MKRLIKKLSTKPSKVYDKENKITPLKLFCLIVSQEQGEYYIKALSDLGVSATYEVYGTGTAPKEIYDLFGIGTTKKDLLIAVVKEPLLEEVKKMVEARFNVSLRAKGIAFTIDIDSMIGVILYRFLTNDQQVM